ncbi:MAG: YmdB family metallophosphoesterase [Planctomycetales bacterium]|nr:YmdB family metallophosphoesterase [Planctomycetales bacterium]
MSPQPVQESVQDQCFGDVPNVSPNAIRIVMVGDVVGKPGMRITCDAIPALREKWHAGGIVVNAENAADGSGLRCKDYQRLVDCGVDAITLGDHAYRKREIMQILESEPNIVRPANLAPNAPGRPHCVVTLADNTQLFVMCLLGRVFMNPCDCPFRAADRELSASPTKIKLVDFHAEATSDMQIMGRYLSGRASAVLGTHTHVATADQQIIDNSIGFQCDVGMTGPHDSILGRKVEAVLQATLHSIPTPFQVATGDVRLNATWFDAERTTGRCLAIGRICLHESVLNDYLKHRGKSSMSMRL